MSIQPVDEIENPLLWPLLSLLQAEPSGWKVHTLAAELRQSGILLELDVDPDLDLFKRNFLIMNALYQLQEILLPEHWLQTLAMDIRLLACGNRRKMSIDTADPLREYYLDWSNYNTTSDEVQDLLDSFWQRYKSYIGSEPGASVDRSAALEIFELNVDATDLEIRRRWRKLALRWHPDRPNGNAKQFRLICQAWQTLRE